MFVGCLECEGHIERSIGVHRRGEVPSYGTGQCAGYRQSETESILIAAGGVFSPEWLEEV